MVGSVWHAAAAVGEERAGRQSRWHEGGLLLYIQRGEGGVVVVGGA